mmetsp:Transcript_1604/g.1418  ORF Transcript_1604/g.1418 Transcript_1604/m.1418 type:complete len:173 (+) Transcript_1604:265-783(+)
MVAKEDLNDSRDIFCSKLFSICILNNIDMTEDEKDLIQNDSSIESASHNFNDSDNIPSSSSTILTSVLPELSKLFKQRNKPLVRFALDQFKHLFGTIGEEVFDKNLLEKEHELFEEHKESGPQRKIHNHIFYDGSSEEAIASSFYTVEQGLKIGLKEPVSEKAPDDVSNTEE